MSNSRETARALESSAAALGFQGAILESLRIVGRYDCVLNECKPEHRREYVPLVGHLGGLNTQLRSIERGIIIPDGAGLTLRAARRSRALLTAPRRHALRREITDIETYLHSLTEPVKPLVAPNIVMTPGGRNTMLDNNFAGSSYTAAYFMGLVSLVSFSAYNAADTMASHAGWLEAGATNAPTYSGARKTAAWSAASAGSKALSAGLVFTFTGTGTVKGCFMNTVSTVDGTTGNLYSGGNFTGGDQPVVATNTLTGTYTATLT